MFERYTEKARRVIFFARWEALQFKKQEIDTEHILLGILREDPVLLGKFLSSDQLASIRQQVEELAPPSHEFSNIKDIPLTDGSKRSLAYAAREAQALEFGYIAPAHLLCGLLYESEGIAAKLLTERGMTSAKVMELLRQTPHKRRSWSFRPKYYRYLHVLHLFTLMALGLLLVQIFGLAMEGRFYRSDVIIDAVALPIVMTLLMGLTWFLEARRNMTRHRAMRYLIGAPLAVLPAAVILIRAFLAPPL